MKIVNISQRGDAWKRWRDEGVTASENATVQGVDPYRTEWQLWSIKKGRIPPPDLDNSPLVLRGRKKEDLARRFYEQRNDSPPLLPICAEADFNHRLRASLDGMDGDLASPIPVELKCPHPTTMRSVVELGKESEAYKLYYYQVQHQIMVTGGQRGFLCFYCDEVESMKEYATCEYTDGNGMTSLIWRQFEIERDDELIKAMIAKDEAFIDLLDKDKPPKKDPERDLFVPEPHDFQQWGSWSGIWLAHQRLIERHQRKMDEAKQRQKELVEQMVGMMGNFVHAEACGVRITRILTQGTVDYRKIVEEKLKLTDAELDAYRGPSRSSVRAGVVSTPPSPKEERAKADMLRSQAESAPKEESVFAW